MIEGGGVDDPETEDGRVGTGIGLGGSGALNWGRGTEGVIGVVGIGGFGVGNGGLDP